MKVEVRPYDVAEFLTDREMIFHYLSEEFEASEPPYAARALGAVIRARGGAERLAAETGVPAETLKRAAEAETEVDRETLQKVIEAFRGATADRITYEDSLGKETSPGSLPGQFHG
jgi:probable addiction module antidote protein